MNYTFTEIDLNQLGVTDVNVRNILLKTTIVGYYDIPFTTYNFRYKPSFYANGGAVIDFINDSNKLFIVTKSSPNVLNVEINSQNYLRFTATIGSVQDNTVTLPNGGGSSSGFSSGSVLYNTEISDIKSINILGKFNIYDIIYDGDSTISHNGNSIKVQVYDDAGLTVLGRRGVKRIIYKGQKVNTLSLNGVSNDVSFVKNYGGYILPKPFNFIGYGGIRNNYLILRNTSRNRYELWLTNYGFAISNDSIYHLNENNQLITNYISNLYVVSFNNSENGHWQYDSNSSGTIPLANREIIASTVDIYNYTSVSEVGELYFQQNIVLD